MRRARGQIRDVALAVAWRSIHNYLTNPALLVPSSHASTQCTGGVSSIPTQSSYPILFISSLTPALPWRGEFVRLTRRFEHEWYGADESTPEALEECQRRARAILESVARASRGAA